MDEYVPRKEVVLKGASRLSKRCGTDPKPGRSDEIERRV